MNDFAEEFELFSCYFVVKTNTFPRIDFTRHKSSTKRLSPIMDRKPIHSHLKCMCVCVWVYASIFAFLRLVSILWLKCFSFRSVRFVSIVLFHCFFAWFFVCVYNFAQMAPMLQFNPKCYFLLNTMKSCYYIIFKQCIWRYKKKTDARLNSTNYWQIFVCICIVYYYKCVVNDEFWGSDGRYDVSFHMNFGLFETWAVYNILRIVWFWIAIWLQDDCFFSFECLTR